MLCTTLENQEPVTSCYIEQLLHSNGGNRLKETSSTQRRFQKQRVALEYEIENPENDDD